MPFDAATALSLMTSTGAGLAITGVQFPSICTAVTDACVKHFIQPATVLVSATGTAGAGVVGPSSPIVGPAPAAMASFMDNQMKTLALVGIQNLSLCTALATGIIAGLSTLALSGVSVGVGIGAGSGKIVGFNSAAFNGFLTQSMTQVAVVGAMSPNFITSLSNGICLYLNSVGSVPVVSIVGLPSSSPGLAMFPAQFV